MFVTGITDDPEAVLPGDLFCCVERLGPGGPADGHEPVALQAALAAGAVAVLAEAGRELPAEVTESDVPVLYASDTDELSGRLAAVYYGEAACTCTARAALVHVAAAAAAAAGLPQVSTRCCMPPPAHPPDAPSSALSVVAVTGTSGKTTVSWLVRGVLEQAGELTGMVGSIEHALAEHLLTPDGQLWEPREADPAAGRECSSPFTLVPYRGRYRVEEATPNGLQMQVRAACIACECSCMPSVGDLQPGPPRVGNAHQRRRLCHRWHPLHGAPRAEAAGVDARPRRHVGGRGVQRAWHRERRDRLAAAQHRGVHGPG